MAEEEPEAEEEAQSVIDYADLAKQMQETEARALALEAMLAAGL